MTTSVGVAATDLRDLNPEELIAAADVAMYASKKRGKNCVTIWSRELGVTGELPTK